MKVTKTGTFEDLRMAGVRLHLVKGRTMVIPEEWAEVLEKARFVKRIVVEDDDEHTD